LSINNKFTSLYLVIGVFLLINTLQLITPSTLDRWNNSFYDHLFVQRKDIIGVLPSSSNIVHVDLNDETINDPKFKTNSKDFLAEVVNRLANSGVKAIVFDMFFDGRSHQKALIKASNTNKIAYYPVILRLDDEETAGVPTASELLKPIDDLMSSAKGFGHISVSQDEDGIIRKYPLVVKYNDSYIPSISLKVALDNFGIDIKDIEIKPGEYIKISKDIIIPIDKQGYMVINFAGNWYDVFAHYSLKKILLANENQLDDLYDELEDSIVIISDTSTWGKDFGSIAFDNMYPLSGLHSNVLNSILLNQFVRHISTIELIFINLLVISLFVLFIKIKKVVLFVMSFFSLLAIVYFSALYGFIYFSILVPVWALFISISLSFILVQSLRYMLEMWQKNLLVSKFSGYFSPSLMTKIVDSPELIDSVEEKPLAVLFSDIAGFTSWCSTREPETIHMVLNQYFSKMAPIVFKYNGTIDKYMGDGLMAFFGDPEDLENPSHNAVLAGLEMQKVCEELRESWKESGVMDLHIRVGINFGDVVVGNMGSSDRMEYTVLGSNVNLAQRLESNAPLDSVLVSKAVADNLNENYLNIQNHGSINAKGFDESILTYIIS